MRYLFVLAILALSVGCTTIKPYEKEYLLNPVMDDAKVSSLQSSFTADFCRPHEKLSSGTPTSSSSGSCPTCGG